MEKNLSITGKNRSVAGRILMVGLFLCMLILPVQAQDKITVTGYITDDTDLPLIGASVLVEGTTEGTVTDVNGLYEMEVAPDADIEVSYVGYKTQVVNVNNRSKIDFRLEPDALMLQEVVAIGYGSERKEDLSMAVSTMNVDESLKSRSSDLATVLQGRLPGVTVMQSGDPMADATFSIRGRGSKGNDGDYASGSGVLIVVDGVPNAPYMVEDIESITVLKDAASAAIYGASVGSAGVVLITTRKPEGGQVRVNVNASYGFENVTNLPEMLTAQQFCDVWAKAVENNPGSTLPNSANPDVYPFANVTHTDWLDEIFRTGTKQHYALSVSGGGEKIQSILSLQYDDHKGTLLNTWTKKFGGKLQTDFRITNWLKLYERVSFNVSNGQGNVSVSHQGPIMGAIWYPRSASVYELNQDGTYALDASGNRYFGGTRPQWATNVSEVPNIYNPVANLSRMHRLYPKNELFSTSGIEIKPITSLTIKSEFTADLHNTEQDEFYPIMTEVGLQRAQNYREQFYNKDNHWLSETTISWAQIFGKHHISAMAGFTAEYTKTRYRAIFTRDYVSEEPNKLLWGMAQDWSTTQPQEEIYEETMASFLARVGYSYDDRYFLTASIRRDASSKLPDSKNFDWFPSVSGSWKLSSEPFFRDSEVKKVLNLVKFRAGWGKIGNVELYPSDVAYAPTLNYDWSIIIGGNPYSGSYLSTIPNYNARWETTVQTSVGLDLTLFNRLDLSVDWYNKVTRDLIDAIPTVVHMGVENDPMGNIGNVLNRGWEFSLNYNGSAANGQLTYNVWGNYSYNKNVVREYGIRDEPLQHSAPLLNSSYLLYSDVGQPWYSFLVYQTNGIFRSQEEIDNYTWTNPETGQSSLVQPDAKVGDLIFADTNNDGKISDDDRVFMGSYAPVHTYSFGASLNWKGFDFSVMFQGVAGNYIYNGLKQMAMNGRNDYGNLISDVLDTWDFNPSSSAYPRLGLTNDENGNYTKFSDVFLEKGDYLRLKNITLGYTLPKFGKNMPGIRVYASCDNVCTITGYTGMDPEVGNYGVDSGVYPLTRFFNFGINLNF